MRWSSWSGVRIGGKMPCSRVRSIVASRGTWSWSAHDAPGEKVAGERIAHRAGTDPGPRRNRSDATVVTLPVHWRVAKSEGGALDPPPRLITTGRVGRAGRRGTLVDDNRRAATTARRLSRRAFARGATASGAVAVATYVKPSLT